MTDKLLDYCGERIREAHVALDKARADKVKAMNSGADRTAMMAHIAVLRERIATYTDVADRARRGEF